MHCCTITVRATGFRFLVSRKPHYFGLLVFLFLIPTNQGRQLKLLDMSVPIGVRLVVHLSFPIHSGTLQVHWSVFVLGSPIIPEVLRKGNGHEPISWHLDLKLWKHRLSENVLLTLCK